MVAENCHSACAIIFLAGKDRYLAAEASLTLHRAYKKINDWVVDDDNANGTVAWFIGYMGYPLPLARLWFNTGSDNSAPVTLEMSSELKLGFTELEVPPLLSD